MSGWRRRLGLTATLATSLAACRGCPSDASVLDPPPAYETPPIERVPLPGDLLRGLSGLARPPGRDDVYLSVAERLHHLVPFYVSDDAVRAAPPIPLEGVETELDVEGLAFIDDHRLVLATEADYERDADKMLFAEFSWDGARVVGEVAFDYDAWGVTPTRNRGLEGICVAAGQVVAASEMVGEQDGERWSPVATFDLAEETWTPYRVFLTSRTGKLSGLSCADDDDGGLQVTAIERHFDLLHVVRFDLDGSGGDRRARVVGDLRPGFAETPPNFEGIEILGPGRYLLATDNDWRGVRGPTEIIRWAERPPPLPEPPVGGGSPAAGKPSTR